MKNGEFKEWLTSNHIYSSKKLITDCVSRAARVEKAFQVTDCAFSFQSEFETVELNFVGLFLGVVRT